jgi:hypothetical protein
MKHFVRAILIALLLLSVLPHLSSAQVPEVRERLGGRLGYVDTFGGFHEHYGAGWNANLYFTERLWKALFLDIRIGAIYMGDLLRPEVAENVLGIPVDSEMRTLFFSVGPQIAWSMTERISPYFGAAVGVYSSSVIFATSIQSADFSDQHLGGNGSVGLLLRFTNTWNLDLNVTLHHFRTSERIGDLFYMFTGQTAEDPFMLQAAIGIAIDLR